MTFSVHRRSLCTCSITVHFLCNWCLTQTSSHSEEIECISQLFNTFTFAHFQCYFCRVNTLKIRGIYSIEWTKSESKFFRTAKSAKNQKKWQTIGCNVITDGQHHMWNIERPEENSTSIIEFPVVRNKPKLNSSLRSISHWFYFFLRIIKIFYTLMKTTQMPANSVPIFESNICSLFFVGWMRTLLCTVIFMHCVVRLHFGRCFVYSEWF